MPRWEGLIGKEESQDGNLMHDYAFAQNAVIGSNVHFKPSMK